MVCGDVENLIFLINLLEEEGSAGHSWSSISVKLLAVQRTFPMSTDNRQGSWEPRFDEDTLIQESLNFKKICDGCEEIAKKGH